MARVLLVDDEPALLFTLSQLLKSRGLEPVLAHSAKEALAKLDGVDGVVTETPWRKDISKFPIMPPSRSVCDFRSPEKHIEYPQMNHKTVVKPMDTKLCIIMERTFLRPTRPP